MFGKMSCLQTCLFTVGLTVSGAEGTKTSGESAETHNTAILLKMTIPRALDDAMLDLPRYQHAYRTAEDARTKGRATDKLDRLKKRLTRIVDQENRSRQAKGLWLESQYKSLLKQLDRAVGTRQEKVLEAKGDILKKEHDELNRICTAYQMYPAYADVGHLSLSTERRRTQLRGTSYHLLGKVTPKLSVKPLFGNRTYSLVDDSADIKIVVFCALQHKASMKALGDLLRLKSSTTTSVIAVNVDREKEYLFKRKSVMKRLKCAALVDDGVCSAACRVIFLPHVLLIREKRIIAVYPGISRVKELVAAAIKN